MRVNPSVDDVVRDSRAWYDRKSRDYAQRTGSYECFPGLIDEITRFADSLIAPAGPVLDLGCGTGRDTEFLRERGFPVVCADLSAAMLLATTTRCGQAVPVQLDMRRLPFRTGTFRGAWVCASLVHLPRPAIPAALAELHRVLGPGGTTAISMKQPKDNDDGYQNGRWFTYIDPEDFTGLLESTGFTRCVAESSGRGSWYIAHGTKPQTVPQTVPLHRDGSSPGKMLRIPPRGSSTSPS